MAINTIPVDTLSSLESPLELLWVTQNAAEPFPFGKNLPFKNWINTYSPTAHNLITLFDVPETPSWKQILLSDYPVHTAILCNTTIEKAGLEPEITQSELNLLQTRLPLKTVLEKLLWQFATLDSPTRDEHGVFLQVHQQGVLVKGRAGIGKSTLALELIERGHQLVADDAPLFYQFPRETPVYGICPPLLRAQLALADLGILDVNKLFGEHSVTHLQKLDLLIELVDDTSVMPPAYLKSRHGYYNILGEEFPITRVYVNSYRNLATIVETVVKNHILYQEGFDANLQLINNQRQLIEDFES